MKHIPILILIYLFSLAVAFNVSSCIHGIDYFPIDTMPIDTTIDVIPLEVDTCEELISLTDTPFVGLTLHFFNGIPTNPEYRYSASPLVFSSLTEVLQFYFPQYTYTEYQNVNSVFVFVDGTDNSNLPWSNIWCRDAAGIKSLINPSSRGVYHYGAMTAEEAIAEAAHRLNIKGTHYTGTNWTEAEQNAYARNVCHFDLCKKGEQRMNYAAADSIAQTVVDSTILFKWQIVTQ